MCNSLLSRVDSHNCGVPSILLLLDLEQHYVVIDCWLCLKDINVNGKNCYQCEPPK